MSAGTAKVAVGASLGSVAFALLFTWVTWNYVMSSMDRTMILDLLGFATLGGQ